MHFSRTEWTSELQLKGRFLRSFSAHSTPPAMPCTRSSRKFPTAVLLYSCTHGWLTLRRRCTHRQKRRITHGITCFSPHTASASHQYSVHVYVRLYMVRVRSTSTAALAWHTHSGSVVHRCGLQAIQRPKTKEPATRSSVRRRRRRRPPGRWLRCRLAG
eukprot:COSAG01_NODE_10220_length_2217_cov_90.292257_1_plen_159_part_00